MKNVDVKNYLSQNTKFFIDSNFRLVVSNFIYEIKQHFDFKMSDLDNYAKSDWDSLNRQNFGEHHEELSYRFKTLAIALHIMVQGIKTADSLAPKKENRVKKILSFLN